MPQRGPSLLLRVTKNLDEKARAGRGSRLMRFAACAAVVLVPLFACTTQLPKKQIEMESIGTVKNVPKPIEDNTPGNTTSPNSGTANAAKEASCTKTEIDNLEDALRSCDVPMPKASDVPPVKDKLEVQVTASTASTTPGGRIDLVLTIHNKTAESLPLFFTGDPSPRFDVEAYDAKGRTRVDLPAGKWPGYPKGFKPEAREAKASRITLEKNGSARVGRSEVEVGARQGKDLGGTWVPANARWTDAARQVHVARDRPAHRRSRAPEARDRGHEVSASETRRWISVDPRLAP
jgi:hypothetical protein